MEINLLYQHFLKSTGICTDSRDIFPGCLFFALKGENFDGNKFAESAIASGASLAVIDDSAFEIEKTVLVPDTLKALQQLANYHRNQLGTPLIALTGSNGKTTTKELIHAVLSQKFKTIATSGNLNNHIGVPLTLLRLKDDTELGVIEMGANHLGEIKMLSELAEPNFGYITNFGKAHLEGFGSLEGVIRGKTELYRFLHASGGTIFVNALNIQQLKQSENMKRILFGSADSNYPIDLLDSSDMLLVKLNETIIQSNLTGIYNFENIAAAIAIGAHFGLTEDQIKCGIESYTPSNHRSQIIRQASNTILMDAYNANPTSMFAALQNFKQKEGYNKVLFLGDMFELGADTDKEHQTIATFIDQNFPGTTYLIGENFYRTKTTNPFIEKFKSLDDLKNAIADKKPKDAVILIKGSRGMALERILDWI